jgi:hypothetical protein
MPNVTYNLGIPDENNNPSVDQPDMKINTDAVDEILLVDHYGFNLDNGGFHKKVTIPLRNIPAAPVGPTELSYIYTDAGTDTGQSEAYFRNVNGIFPVSALKAAGRFTTVSSSPPTLTAEYNISTITGSTSGTSNIYTVTLSTNATIGASTAVLLATSSSASIGVGGTVTSNVATIRVSGSVAGTSISFIILEF